MGSNNPETIQGLEKYPVDLLHSVVFGGHFD